MVPRWSLVLGVAVLVLCLAAAQPAGAAEKDRLNDLDLVEDDGSIETALMNYLFAKHLMSRLSKEMDVTDMQRMQRKRSYWKQCAFNAVSCFGK